MEFFTLASNELLYNLEFLCATRFDTTRIVKNVTLMIGEHKFVVDLVLASLALCSDVIEEKYCCHEHPWTGQVQTGRQ